MSSEKGGRRERELVNLLYDYGFAAVRAPSSGSATPREMPDVLAGNGDQFYAIEAKASQGDPVYLTGDEIEGLVYFARNFGGQARVGVRFDREEWYFFHPNELHYTDGGNYRIKRERAIEEGTTLDEL